MPEKRELEDTAGGRFWEIWADGNTVYTRSGKTGSAGQTKLKEVSDVADEIQKQVTKKLAEGFLEKGGGPKGPELDAKELRRHLKNLTGAADDGGYLVLADWLQQQNHPWGELIALQHAAATGTKTASLTKQAEKHLITHRGAILGELATSKRFDAAWDRGFIKKLTLGVPADSKGIVKAVKALATLPAAHLVEAVALDPSPESFSTWRESEQSREHVIKPWTDLEKVVAALPASVKHVGLGGWPASAAGAYVEMPTFTDVSNACATLPSVEITGTSPDKLGKLSLPEATHLCVHFANASVADLAALASAKLPKLEHLHVWLGGESHVIVDSVHEPDEWEEDVSGLDRYPPTFSADDLGAMEIYQVDVEVTPESLTELLAAKWTAKLKHLGIGAPELSAELVGAIAKAPVVATLESLALEGLTETGTDALVKAKKSFTHLTRLDLSRNKLTKDTIGNLRNAFAAATLPEAGAGSEPFLFRYVATME